jgi:hypothetical protein
MPNLRYKFGLSSIRICLLLVLAQFAMDKATGNRLAKLIKELTEHLVLPARKALTSRGLFEDAVVKRDVHSSIFIIKGDKKFRALTGK